MFKDNSIEMDDFTLRFKGLPNDIKYAGNLEALKAYLYNHFQQVIKNQMELEKHDELKDPINLDIAEINFGLENIDGIEKLK